MIIAVTAAGNGLDAQFEARFGRASGFLIVDSESDKTRYISNTQNLNAAQGAGIQAAQKIAGEGAGVVITGHCGPKAFQVLSAAGIKIYLSQAATVKEALESYKAGKLSLLQNADVEGHW